MTEQVHIDPHVRKCPAAEEWEQRNNWTPYQCHQVRCEHCGDCIKCCHCYCDYLDDYLDDYPPEKETR